jgi:Holliday junction resolvase RusA-like endonuclease
MEKIVIDYKLKNWNEIINTNRRNRYAGANEKKKESRIVMMYLLGVKPIKKYPIKLDCTWHVSNLNSDLDNKSLKVALDTMQNMGILENDNIKHINEINHKAVKDERDYLAIEIKENY